MYHGATLVSYRTSARWETRKVKEEVGVCLAVYQSEQDETFLIMPEGIAERFLTVHFWKCLGAGSLKAVLSVDQWSRYDCGECRRPIFECKSPFCLHRAAHIEQCRDLGTKRSQYHMEMFSCCAQPVIRLALDYSPDLEFSLMSNSGCVCTCQIIQNSFRPFSFFFLCTPSDTLQNLSCRLPSG